MAGRGRVYLIIYYIGRGGPTPAHPGREGEGETENGKLTYPLRRFAPLSSVALGSAPLRGYRSTFSASSKDPLRPPVSGGQRKRETESGRSFYERRKAGRENEMPRNAKTRIWRVRFCPPEHMNMLSGRTRASHRG